MFNFIKQIFEKEQFSTYKFVKTINKKTPLTKTVEDVTYSHGYGISDPLDVLEIPTGEYYVRVYELWVANSLRTGLPKYKYILIDEYKC